MDNVKYYNDSLAYDFEMFMPKTKVRPEEKDNIIKLPEAQKNQRAKRTAATRKLSVSAFAVMFSVVVLAALCGNIFLRLQINEVNSKTNDIKAQINALDSEKTSLDMELERRISYSNIELAATEMGMQKRDKSQVKYIRVNDKDTVVNEEGKTTELK